MMKILDVDRPLGQFLCKIGDIIILNFLWIICSIPIITIGASTSALYYTWMKQFRKCDIPVYRLFFSSFKENLRQSTAAWMFSLLMFAVLMLDIFFLKTFDASIGKVGLYFFIILFIGFVMILLYLFPVIAAFKASTIQHFKNAFFLTFSHPLATLILFISTVIPVGVTYYEESYFGVYLFCWIFFGISLLNRFQSWILIKIFCEYLE